MNKHKNHMARRRAFESSIFRGFCWCFGILAVLSFAGVSLGEDQSGAALAALPFLGIKPMLCKEFEPNSPGGGSALSTPDFQAKVIGGIGEVKKQYETLETRFSELDKESKEISDKFGKSVKEFEGLPSQIGDITRQLQQIQLKVARERRSSFGSAVERISADDDCRNTINGLIRMAARRHNPSIPITEEQTKGAEEYMRALTTASGSGASYINAQLIPDIYSTVAEYGIWNRFDVVPVATTSAKLIVDSTDPVMAWTAENTASSETGYTSANVTASIGKLLGWIQVATELVEDAEIDLTGHVLRKFANATAYALDFACTSADGGADATDGGFTGIFGGSGTASVAASGNVSVATLDFEDWLNAMLVVDASVLSKPTAAWVIHPQMLVRALSIKDLNGRPIFLPSTDAPSLGAVGSILGYPVVLAHTANATDGVSKKIAVFGDLMGQAVCLRSDFQFAASDQVKFTEDSIVFRARARGAAKTKKATSFGVLTTSGS